MVRAGDAVGRLGGEEFVLVLPGVAGEAAAEAAERARAALAEVQVGRRRLECSAGVATFPDDAREAAELLERADAALYAAKHAGRRQTRRYAANLAARPSLSDERGEVEALLRRGEDAIQMVFQPVLELATGRVCGYEALARFDGEPVRRPDQWFAQAHRCGLGAELEALALRAALAVQDRPPGTFLALNVSPGALLAPPIAEILPADLSDVVIELTEHELFTADERLEACLAELRERGARVALDDAGAGYAGLQQLIRVAPDILKIDRSLVHGAHSDPSRYALLEALVSFAGTTGAAVCGEGVEDMADLGALADLDATYAQGYALARPAGPWAPLSPAIAATGEVRQGVRVAAAAVSNGAGWARTLAELGDDLADVTDTAELATAGRRAARLLGAEDVSLMWVVDGALELLSDNKDTPGDRWDLADFPATMRLLDAHVPGQVVVGDTESDPDEIAELVRLGYGAVLMVPVRVSRHQRALVEVYRAHPQAFTSTEVDRARVVAQQFGPVLARLADLTASAAGGRPGARRSRDRSRPRPASSTGSSAPAGGFRRRSSSPTTAPNSRCRQADCANARPLRPSAGWTRTIAGQVARCSSSAESGPRSTGATGRLGATLAYSAPNSAPFCTCSSAPTADASERPGATSRPSSSASSWSTPNTRLSSGCWASQTAAPAIPATAPRRVRLRSIAIHLHCNERSGAGYGCHVTPARLSRMHARARERGVNPIVYWLTRALFQPFAHLYWRMSRIGREHIPTSGPVIFASNHRSFLDPFVIGTIARRPMYYVAKQEIFKYRLVAWFLNSLGAFPVRRGAADADMLETARAILERGDCVLMFPEGTRTRPGALGRPKRGVGRLALETGAPIVPVAVRGTEAVRKGWWIRPHKVRIRIGRPLTFPKVEKPSQQLAAAVTDRVWPNVMLQWEWLGGLPPLRRAAVIGAGSWGTSLAVMLARSGVEVDLGTRTREQAEQLAAAGVNERYLPGVALPGAVRPRRAADLELSRHDLVCFAVPAAALPAVVAAHAGAISPRSGALVMSKGLVPPLGTLPAAFVAERVPAWAVGVLGGPAEAGSVIAGGGSLVLATQDAAFARQVGDALAAAGLDVVASTDLVGVELAGLRQERRRARRGRRRPRRRGRRRRQGVRRGRCVCAALRLAAGNLHRPGRHRRPGRHGAGGRLERPPRRRAARAGRLRRRARRRARPRGRGGRLRSAARRAHARRRGRCPGHGLARRVDRGPCGAGALRDLAHRPSQEGKGGALRHTLHAGWPPHQNQRPTGRPRRSWTPPSRSSTGRTCATSTRTRTTGWATTTTPRISPSRRSCRRTGTSTGHSASRRAARCGRG